MAMTNAEKQAAHRAKIAEKTAFLEAANAALAEENAVLRTQLDKAKAKVEALKKKLKVFAHQGETNAG